jgi:hypothetical protein
MSASVRRGSQVFITTHQPYFVDALSPEDVWILEKEEFGFSTIRRASDDATVKNMVAEGLPLGGLWYKVISPGGLYGQVTRENFGQPGLNDYRNPNLAEAMRHLG